MRSVVLSVLCSVVLQDKPEEFDPSKVNRLIVALSEDPSQEAQVVELHGYLKKHDKLARVAAKFEESFERRPRDAKLRYLLGRLHLLEGNRAGAIKCFQAAAQADPDYPFTYLAQAELFEGQGDEKGLVVALEGVMQSSKEKAAVAGAVRRLATHYGKKQDLDRVASLWGSLVDRYPDDRALLEEALRSIVATGRLPKAREALRAALSRNFLSGPDRARLFLELATLERRTGSPSEASKALTAAAEAAGGDPALGRKIDESILAFYREENRLAELVAIREKDLASNDTDPVRIWRLARAYIAQTSPSRARELLAEGLKRNPGNLLILAALADVAESQGKFAEVRDLARDLASREPQQREHRKRQGIACLELSNFAEAGQAFGFYAVTPAEFAEVGRIYERRNRLLDAVVFYRRSLELRFDLALSRTLVGLYVQLDRVPDADQEAARCTSGDRERWALLRELLSLRGDLTKACAYAKKDADANPKDFRAQLVLGKLLAGLKNAEAEATLRKALSLAKQGERGETYEELAALVSTQGPAAILLLRGELRTKISEDPGEGGYYYALYRLPSGADGRASLLRILEEGRKNDPRHVRLRQELGPLYAQQKQYDVAIDLYRELLEIDPGRRDLYAHAIGEIYWSLGHKEEAFGWWAKVSGTGKDKVGLSFQLAKKYEAERRYPQAIELLQKIVLEEPDGVLYHWALAQLYRQVNDFEGIEREFKWILGYAKDEGYVRTARQVLAEKMAERGRVLAEEGKHLLSLEAFTEALRYAPDEPATGSLLALIARVCEQVRDYARAADLYHQILFKYPTIVVTLSPGRTMNAALFASLQLRANPECLKAYETLVGVEAGALLNAALQKGDRAGLERVIASYPLTEAAGVAAFSLGEMDRKGGEKARAAGFYERLLSELSLAAVDETLVRIRLVELSAQLKDWGVLGLHLGELLTRSKDKVLTVDGRTVAVRDFVKTWQKELITHGVGLGVSWGLFGKDSRNSSSTIQELHPPLLPKWKYNAFNPNNGNAVPGLPPIYAAAGLVFLAKEDVLVALDAGSGGVRWTGGLRVLRSPANRQNVWTGGPSLVEGRLAVAQGVVLGVDLDNELRAFDAATGNALWSHASDLPRLNGAKPVGRVRTGVAPGGIEHLEILSATRQCFIVREADKLRAYSLRTGRMEWQSTVQAGTLPLALDPGPAGNGIYPDRLNRFVLESDGVLIHAFGDSIRALDTLTGRDLWEVRVPPKGALTSSPWAQYFTFVSEGVAGATISGELLLILTAADGKLTAFELRTGRVRWDNAAEGAATEGQLASDDQQVYVLTNKTLAACTIKTGERLWHREIRPLAPMRQQNLPPVFAVQNRLSVAGSKVYFVSGDDPKGTEAAKIEAIDRKNGSTVWDYAWEPVGKVMQGVRAIGFDPWGRPILSQVSAPVISDGWLYVVRSDGVLYSFHGKSQEVASLREAIRTDPESPQAHFRLGDLLGSEGSTSLEIEEYRSAIRLAQKKPETAALKEMVAEAKSRLFVRFMRQGESSPDLEAALKAFVEARSYAEGETGLARVLVRTAAVLLALKRDLDALEALSSILGSCASAPSPLEGPAETSGEFAKRHLERLGPQVRAQWEKAHAEEIEKAFAAGRSVAELEKAIERYSFLAKADTARIQAARMHLEEKRYKEAALMLERMRPEFLETAEAEKFFEAYDLLGRALAALGEDRRALGTYQKLLSEIAKDEVRLGSLKERAEGRHKEVKESWERNGTFSTPLQTIWTSPAPAGGAPKPAGPTMGAFRPAIDCGKIFCLDLQGNLQACDAGSGAVAWQAKTEDFAPFLQNANNLVVLALDPLLAARNGLLVVGGKTVRAFDAASGKLLWSMTSVDGDAFAQQVLIEGNRVLTCETKGRVTAREARSGKLLWSARPGASGSGIVSDRSGTCGGGLLFARMGVEGVRVVVQPAGDPGTLYGYDLVSGKQAWKVVDATYTGYLKGRVILDVGFGMACLADPSGLIVCHELADGKVRWKLNLSVPVDGLLVSQDRIVAATSEQVAAYAAKTGKKEWAVAADPGGFGRDRDMRIGATSLDAKGKWLVSATAGSVSIFDLASGQLKDQIRSEAAATPARPAGKVHPFGKSFAGVTIGVEGILWGLASELGTQWTLLR